MHDLDKALADIFAIRGQIAAGTAFRGYGPVAMATTGGLALFAASVQFVWMDDPTDQPLTFFAGWIALSTPIVAMAETAADKKPDAAMLPAHAPSPTRALARAILPGHHLSHGCRHPHGRPRGVQP